MTPLLPPLLLPLLDHEKVSTRRSVMPKLRHHDPCKTPIRRCCYHDWNLTRRRCDIITPAGHRWVHDTCKTPIRSWCYHNWNLTRWNCDIITPAGHRWEHDTCKKADPKLLLAWLELDTSKLWHHNTCRRSKSRPSIDIDDLWRHIINNITCRLFSPWLLTPTAHITHNIVNLISLLDRV